MKELLLERVVFNTPSFEEFSELKITLINYHAPFAEKLGFIDSAAANYGRKEVIDYFNNNDYDRFLIKKDNTTLGIIEYYLKQSEIDEDKQCLYIDNLYIKDLYRGYGYSRDLIRRLKKQYGHLELTCYYDLPANDVYKQIGFKKLCTTYFF